MISSENRMQSLKALLLVGGHGTRLRSVLTSVPKPLAPVGGRPFLELLVRQLALQGICKLVLCTGYRAEQIEQTFSDGSKLGVTIEYSREWVPLGTAGAVKLAQRRLQQLSDFLVLNGDSLLDIDFQRLIGFHRGHCGVATIAAVSMLNTDRYGAVQAGADGRVNSFAEKSGNHGPGLINAGVYVFSTKILELIPEGPVSLERDLLPRLLSLGVYALEQHGIFIDIGTPADYARAQELYQRISERATRTPLDAPASRACE
jgi:NDP-sugar pyrophosphorylase family protein